MGETMEFEITDKKITIETYQTDHLEIGMCVTFVPKIYTKEIQLLIDYLKENYPFEKDENYFKKEDKYCGLVVDFDEDFVIVKFNGNNVIKIERDCIELGNTSGDWFLPDFSHSCNKINK